MKKDQMFFSCLLFPLIFTSPFAWDLKTSNPYYWNWCFILGRLHPGDAYNQHLCRPMLQTPGISRYRIIYVMLCDCKIVPFVHEKHPWRSATFSKITGLLKVSLCHGCFPRFLNCKNGSWTHKASQIIFLELQFLWTTKTKNAKVQFV